MLRVLIAFASSEGQTEAVAHRLAGRLEAVGCVVRLRELGSERSETATEAWDAAILAGSIHVGQYQPALERFIAAHAEQLRRLQTAFVSVSLSAASRDPAEQAAIRSIAAKLFEKTGWQPDRTAHVAGAVHDNRLGWLKRLVLHAILRTKGVKPDPSGHTVLTDWQAVDAFARDFRARLGSSAS
ncbi:MAG: flavodoxin domain-containing protein [Hyphomicrobiaceae bacterium]